MDSQIQTSFMPKQAAPDKPAMAVVKPAGSNFLNLIAIIVLIVSLLLAGGAYFYKLQLENEINTPCPDATQADTTGCGLLATLTIQKGNLKETLLAEMQRFDLKLRIANNILNEHVTLIPLFQLLNDLTLKSVRYTNFGIKGNEVTMKGTAPTYDDVAVQSKKFYSDKRFINPLFSDLDIDNNGRVVFKLTFTVDPEFLLYTNYVNSNAAMFATSTVATSTIAVPKATTTPPVAPVNGALKPMP